MTSQRFKLFCTVFFISIVFFSCTSKQEIPPYKNPENNIEERVDDLLSRMTIEEKAGQLIMIIGLERLKRNEERFTVEEIRNNDAHGFYPGFHTKDLEKMIKEGKIGSIINPETPEEANYLQKLADSSRLGIPLINNNDAIHGHGMKSGGATIFPTPISLASAWDTAIVKEIADITAKEMRATGDHWNFSPNVDVALDPRWGRVGETFGEDPWLCGLYGDKMVEGYQGRVNQKYLDQDKVAACAKHYIAGSEPSNGLNFAPMDLSERKLREIYLPPYKACIQSGLLSIMAAHNEVNGMPCHADKYLLNDILRKEADFQGMIVSDWTDVERLYYLHKIAPDFPGAVKAGLSAGVDMMNHGPEYHSIIVELVKSGRIKESVLNTACKRVLTLKFKLGLFENRYVDPQKSKEVLLKPEHKKVALKAARQGLVLLKNDNNYLPLEDTKQKILITGPNADKETILGDWTVNQPDENIITILEGFRKIAKNSTINHAPVSKIRHITDEEIQQAVRKARDADVVVLAMGENSLRYQANDKTCGENVARTDLQLPGNQLDFVKAIEKTGKPIIVVLVNGRPLAVNWCDEHAEAIVEAWEPGMFGGQAVAEAVFGKINPSGKLPISFPSSVGHIVMPHYHRPGATFREYVFKKDHYLYEFGHGLSYTSFEYGNLKIPASIQKDTPLKIKVDVSNTGEREGDETVLVYVNDLVSSVTTPVKKLKAFKKVHLKAGETKTVELEIPYTELGLYNLDMEYVVEPGGFEVYIDELNKTFRIQ